MLKKTILIAAAASMIPASVWAGARRSIGSGIATGVGSGLITGDAGTGLGVGAATTGLGLLGGCAPGEMEENLRATESALQELARTHEFSDARLFKAELLRISQIQDPEVRVAQLYRLAGVNPNSSEAIVEFLNERDFRYSRYADNVKANLNLNDRQAVLLLDEVTESIAGGLR